ncbi:UBC-like protein, partial [Ascobolus immersus RN42]
TTHLLSTVPTLSPRTAVYTHTTGHSELLLQLSGTLPTPFRGQTYNFPITLWIPRTYPREPPHVYVTPPKEMVVAPGNHVDTGGRCYHPYLAGW